MTKLFIFVLGGSKQFRADFEEECQPVGLNLIKYARIQKGEKA